MKNYLAAIGLLAVVSGTVVMAAKIQTQRDPTFDFSRLATWSWNPSGAGDVKVIMTANSKSEPVKRQYEPALMKAVEDQIAVRGYTPASGAPPDFHVTYYLLVTQGSSAQYMGQFLPTNAQWGIPMFAPGTSALTVYPQGTLILDVSVPAPGSMVWRGMAEAKIEIENTEEKRIARLNSVIKELVAKFPKAAKKK